MIPKLVTFDCAGTLVGVPEGWSLGGFAADCAKSVGLDCSSEDAQLYQDLYEGRLREFIAVNMARDAKRQQAFWRELAADWLSGMKQPETWLEPMQKAADELGFGPNSILFKLFDDVLPCLDQLDALGIKVAVISNWDYSLHRVLKTFGINDRFLVVTASLEEGVEKPDPRLFEITLKSAGFAADETFHVGDHLVDDIEGAANAGIRAVRVDRSLFKSEKPVISTLADLPEAFDWIA